jgi:hypothetical protein
VEIWDRDIHQKKRVDMDVQIEIQKVLEAVDKETEELKQRQSTIHELQDEMLEAEEQLKDF